MPTAYMIWMIGLESHLQQRQLGEANANLSWLALFIKLSCLGHTTYIR